MPNGQDYLAAKYFHVIRSPLGEARDGIIRVDMLEYFLKNQMMMSLRTKCADPGRGMTVHRVVAYAKERANWLQKYKLRNTVTM